MPSLTLLLPFDVAFSLTFVHEQLLWSYEFLRWLCRLSDLVFVMDFVWVGIVLPL